jgi:hypothetical protein
MSVVAILNIYIVILLIRQGILQSLWHLVQLLSPFFLHGLMLGHTYGLQILVLPFEQVWKGGLGLCVESWGNNNNRTNWLILHKFFLCCHSYHPEFHTKVKFGTTWNPKDGCHGDIWQVCQNLYLGYGWWLKANNTQALSSYLEFFPQYVQLVNMYNIGRPATLLVKNIKAWFCKGTSCNEFFKHVCNPYIWWCSCWLTK